MGSKTLVVAQIKLWHSNIERNLNWKMGTANVLTDVFIVRKYENKGVI